MRNMILIKEKDILGRDSLRPKFDTAIPLFMHITGGSFSVTVESWNLSHDLVAAMHGVSVTVEADNG